MGWSEGKCHFCKIEKKISLVTHLFYEWRVIKDVLMKIQTKIKDTLQSKGYRQRSLDLKMVILGVEENEECVRISLNTILHILKWELRKIRNIIKYENKTYPNEAIDYSMSHHFALRREKAISATLRNLLRVQSVISVNGYYIRVL